MIKQFFVENFKSFYEPTVADISDLLIVAGSNSGGKSSLIQALLLLSQTLDNPRPDIPLDIGGRYVQFSEFKDVVFGRPRSKNANFTVGFNLEIEEDDLTSLTHYYYTTLRQFSRVQGLNRANVLKASNKVSVKINFSVGPSGKILIQWTKLQKIISGLGSITLDVGKFGKKFRTNWVIRPEDSPSILQEKKNVQGHEIIRRLNDLLESASLKEERKNPFVSFIDMFGLAGFELKDVPEIGEQLTRILNQKSPRGLTQDHLSKLAEIFQDICLFTFERGTALTSLQSVRFDHFLISLAPRISGIDNAVVEKSDLFITTFGTAVEEIRKYLRSFHYVGPLRAKPERVYLSTGSPIDIGNLGENAIPLLWLNQNEKVDTKTKIGELPREKKLVKAVQEWLEEFEIAHSFHITKPTRAIYQTEIESSPGSKTMVTIADVGFGVSQILPAIVAGLRAPSGSTVILEQPEIHLHPKLQGKLADFLICLVELGKRVIVETHSEHLINMLRLHILRDSSGNLQRQIGIIFVRNWQQMQAEDKTIDERDKQGSFLENLKVDEYGKIINWPPDFFPESSRLNEEILKAMMEKF